MGIVNLSQAPADLADENECELRSWIPVLFGFVNLSELALGLLRKVGCVLGCVEYGKVRHGCCKSTAPTPGIPRKTDIMS